MELDADDLLAVEENEEVVADFVFADEVFSTEIKKMSEHCVEWEQDFYVHNFTEILQHSDTSLDLFFRIHSMSNQLIAQKQIEIGSCYPIDVSTVLEESLQNRGILLFRTLKLFSQDGYEKGEVKVGYRMINWKDTN